VLVGVGVAGGASHAGGATDKFLVGRPPRGGRHKGFVVESGGYEAVHHIIDGADVEFQAGPPVLAGSDQPVEQFNACGL
ncbi:MAG: hypothetical protein ACKVKG_17415, partial [Alphaproteobacteria bacterium]